MIEDDAIVVIFVLLAVLCLLSTMADPFGNRVYGDG